MKKLFLYFPSVPKYTVNKQLSHICPVVSAKTCYKSSNDVLLSITAFLFDIFFFYLNIFLEILCYEICVAIT